MKVLIVDENEADLVIQTDLLALRGCTVIPAGTEMDGVRCIAEEMPDLVLADVPRLEGDTVGFGSTLRAVAAIYDIPVIAVSIDDDIVSLGDSLGCAGAVSKPIDVRMFAADILRIAHDHTASGA